MSYYTQLRPQCEPATIQVTNEEEAAPSTAPISQSSSSSWSYRSSQWARSVWYRFAHRQLHDDEAQPITTSSSRPVQMYALTNSRQGHFVVNDEDIEAESDKKTKDKMLSEDTLHCAERCKRGQDNNDLDSIRLSIRKSSLLLDADTPSAQSEPWYRRSIGLIYMILANVMFSAMGLTIKALSKSSERIPVLELVAIRGSIGFLLCLGLMWREGIKEYFGPPETRKLLLIRGLAGFTSLTFNLYALNALSLGDATVLGFLAPTFTGLLGKIVLKEAWEVGDCIIHS